MSVTTPAYSRTSNDSWLDDLVGTIIDAGTSTPSHKSVQRWDHESNQLPNSHLEIAAWLDSQARPLPEHKHFQLSLKPVRSLKPSSSRSIRTYSSPRSTNSKAIPSNVQVPVRESSRSISSGRASISIDNSLHASPKQVFGGSGQSARTRHQYSSRSSSTWTPELESVSSAIVNLASALQVISSQQTLQHAARLSSPGPKHRPQSEQASSRLNNLLHSINPQSSAKACTSADQVISEKPFQPRHSGFKTDSNTSETLLSVFEPHPAVRPFGARNGSTETARNSGEDNKNFAESVSTWTLLIGLYLIAFIVSIDRVAVTTVIPHIIEAFASYDDQAWYGSAYLLVNSVSQLLYNRIYTSFNTKWTFLIALAMFGIGSLISGFSSNTVALVCGRSIQGVGSAGALAGCPVVAGESKILQRRCGFFTGFHAVFGIGALIGPLLGGVFTDTLTWRWTVSKLPLVRNVLLTFSEFWINVPVMMIGFVIVVLFFTPEAGAADNQNCMRRILKLDLIGASLLTIACVMLFLALQLSITYGDWNSPSCVGLLCGSCVAAVVLVLWLMYQGEEALIPLRIIRHRNVMLSCITAFLNYGTIFLHAFYLPFWFHVVRGNSAVQSGIGMMPYVLFSAIFYLIAGAFVSKFGLFALPATLGTAVGSIGAGLLTTLSESTTTGTWVCYEIVVSAGMGMAVQHNLAAVQASLPPEDISIATAAVVGFQSLGGAVFVSVANTVLQYRLFGQVQSDTDKASTSGLVAQRSLISLGSVMVGLQSSEAKVLFSTGLRRVFIVALPLCVCAFFCSLFIDKGWKRHEKLEERDDETAA